jgi:hypothetical protein
MKFPYNRALDIQRAYKQGKLTREEATQQLSFILDLDDSNDFCAEAAGVPTEYWKPSSYGPLLRLSDVCNTLRLWAKTYCVPVEGEDKWTAENRRKFYETWQYVDIQISKSCLLDRLFFQDDEVIRTVPCPAHKGKWSGCAWGEPECATQGNPMGCMNGSNVTGWLPLPENMGYDERPDAPKCDYCGKPPLKHGLWFTRFDGKQGHPECDNLDKKMQRLGEALKSALN